MSTTRVPVCWAMSSALRRSNSGCTKMTCTFSLLQVSIKAFRCAGDGSFATGFDGNLMQSVVAGEIRECRVVNHKGMVCAGCCQCLPYEAVGMFYLPAKSIIAFQIKIFVAFVDIT